MTHFYDLVPDAIKKLSIRDAIGAYERGADVPQQAIAGLSREQLTAFPVPDTWSIHQIVVHLMDSDLISTYRMKRTIAEDNPLLDVYAEGLMARRLFYHDIDPSDACEIFARNRNVMTTILRRLDESAFQRTARHPEAGPITLDQIVRVYIHHLDHHMGFVRRKRAMLLGA